VYCLCVTVYCTVLLPPGDNSFAVNRYMNMNINFKIYFIDVYLLVCYPNIIIFFININLKIYFIDVYFLVCYPNIIIFFININLKIYFIDVYLLVCYPNIIIFFMH